MARRAGRCYLSGTAQLAIVVLNVAAALVVAQGGIFHLAIFLLAAGLERIAIYLNVLAGLGERAAWTVISIAVISVAIAIVIVVVVPIVVAAICVMMVVAAIAIVAIVVAVAIISAGATEVSVQVLDLSAATLEIRELSVSPVAAFVLAGGMQG